MIFYIVVFGVYHIFFHCQRVETFLCQNPSSLSPPKNRYLPFLWLNYLNLVLPCCLPVFFGILIWFANFHSALLLFSIWIFTRNSSNKCLSWSRSVCAIVQYHFLIYMGALNIFLSILSQNKIQSCFFGRETFSVLLFWNFC